MPDNLATGPDAPANFAIASVAAANLRGRALDTKPLVPGVWWSPSPATKITGTHRKAAGAIFEVDATVETPGDWLAFHVDMGPADMTDAHVLGLLMRSSAPEAFAIRVCIRSGIDNGFTDTFFLKHAVSFAEPSVHFDLMKIEEAASLPRKAKWRQLVLHFPQQDFSWRLEDLRIFIA